MLFIPFEASRKEEDLFGCYGEQSTVGRGKTLVAVFKNDLASAGNYRRGEGDVSCHHGELALCASEADAYGIAAKKVTVG